MSNSYAKMELHYVKLQCSVLVFLSREADSRISEEMEYFKWSSEYFIFVFSDGDR